MSAPRRRAVSRGARAVLAASAALVASAAVAAVGCGAAPAEATSAPAASARPRSDFDPCEGAAAPARAYAGVLREARCEQELYLTMAAVADALDVTCAHCHVPAEGGGPKDFDFPVMTRNKEIANWMKHQLVDRLRHRDGSPVTCASCHRDAQGRSVAKILGEPRDPERAMEWMSLFLVNELVRADGGKLRCRDCHGAAPGLAGFATDLILERELALPLRDDRAPPGRATPHEPPPADAAPDAPPLPDPADAPGSTE